MGVDEHPAPVATGHRRAISVDLLLVVAISIAAGAVGIGAIETRYIALLLLPLVFFAPGYAVIAALFPAAPRRPVTTSGASWGTVDGIDSIERLALGLATSVVLLSLVGIMLHWSGLGITQLFIIGSLGAIAVVASIIAIVRRWRLAANERYVTPVIGWATTNARSTSGVELAVNGTLVLTILIAMLAVGFAVASPQAGAGATEFYVLAPDGDDGWVASGYPEEVVVGENITLGLGLENHELTANEYTVVIVLEDVDTAGEGTEILDREELTEMRVSLDSGETWFEEIAVAPATEGQNMRLSLYVFEGDRLHFPSQDNADLHLHLWIDVVAEE